MRPKLTLMLNILHSPIYTGAYVVGRNEERMGLVDGELRRRYKKRLPQDAWKVCLRDHQPAYIDWDESMANQRKLDENRTSTKLVERRGAARE